ncbi:lipoprotein cytochrome c [Citrifermentans bemidjiense Bem]|uniref:Lipoprotein cytochrome c n=1 Tax=Citrifermentans bemidjiense (strain ATCC BAA-1014 / DSM 16622 / JCM 12645 / Bem) TaxID=404380 RepID=B5EB34_CITBB|nr:cytochrome c [Citrifermentans bemidjiense]ACH38895.1 lipoprotein cytochrome c [Citrifermentans bemidjiense Bem]
MKQLIRTKLAVLYLFLMAVIAGCGGGGGSSSANVVNGVAAVGAPLAGQVTLKDSSAQPREKSTAIDQNGNFAFDVTGMTAPFIMQAKGSAGGTNHTLHSLAKGSGRANINPLSDLIVASAAGVSDPATAYADPDPAHTRLIGDNLAAASTTVLAKLQPLLAQFGVAGTDPITAPFVANHQSMDLMFDQVTVTLSAGAVSIVNKQSGSVICNGSVMNLAAATFNAAAIPVPATGALDGMALYNQYCDGCHGTAKLGRSALAIHSAIITNTGGMGSLSTLTDAQITAIAAAAAPVVTPPPASTPLDGQALYTQYCNGCHGSAKLGKTAVAIQGAINANTGGMGSLSTLTAAQVAAIATTTAPVVTPPPATTPLDGQALYTQYCNGCHGSAKQGKTALAIQGAINANTGGMGSLSTLTAAQVAAIATTTAPVVTAPTPPACGSCHAIPPATGKHAYHSTRATCANCHGTGYSTTTVNAATHANGVKNLTTSIGWNSTNRTCSNSCHGTKAWGI